jgi:hypothetical protein
MKMHLSMTVKGKESFKEKFEKAIKLNPNLHLFLIQNFAPSLMMALGLTAEDGVVVDSFNAKFIEDELKKPTEEEIQRLQKLASDPFAV